MRKNTISFKGKNRSKMKQRKRSNWIDYFQNRDNGCGHKYIDLKADTQLYSLHSRDFVNNLEWCAAGDASHYVRDEKGKLINTYKEQQVSSDHD